METKTTIDNFEEVLTAAQEISQTADFASYCNSREFEERLSKVESFVVMNDKIEEQIKQYVRDNQESQNHVCYVLFLILFTAIRRKKKGNLEGYTREFLPKFKQYPFSEFIEILMLYNVKKDDEHLHELLIRSKRLSESKGVGYDFTAHNGIINLYVEVVCTFFELNLDKRQTQIDNYNCDEKSRSKAKNDNYISDAIDKINFVIAAEEKVKGYDKAYAKFYLNKGRLEVLLGNYNVGEEYIIKAIQNIPPSAGRAYTVHEYELFLSKIDMIRLYDLNNTKIKEIEKTKVDNIKSLSLMTALLSFILGTINIFSEVKDVKALAVLMVTYCGLVLTLLGVLLLGIKLLYNERNRKFGVYNALIFVSGIIIFGASILLLIL